MNYFKSKYFVYLVLKHQREHCHSNHWKLILRKPQTNGLNDQNFTNRSMNCFSVKFSKKENYEEIEK